MKKDELIERLAERTHTTPAEAADQLDAVVHSTLSKLRRGKKVVWPGLGLFQPGDKSEIRFEESTPATPEAPGATGKSARARKGKPA